MEPHPHESRSSRCCLRFLFKLLPEILPEVREMLSVDDNLLTIEKDDPGLLRLNLYVRNGIQIHKRRLILWLIVHEHDSVPVDVASGKADITAKP
jgi:hypothetical protein